MKRDKVGVKCRTGIAQQKRNGRIHSEGQIEIADQSHAKPRRTRRTRRGLNSIAEESSSGESAEKPYKAFSFAFFAASREKNLLSKFASNCGCAPFFHRPPSPHKIYS